MIPTAPITTRKKIKTISPSVLQLVLSHFPFKTHPLRSMVIGKQRRHDQEADMDDWSSVRGPKHEKDREESTRSSSISGHKDSSSSSSSAKWKCSDQKWVMQTTKQPSTCPESNSTECHKASSYSPTWPHRRRRRPSNSTNRVCSDCSTTSTPLWRSGPNGPKSLCNACGIRQRKAIKAMEEEGRARGWCAKTRIGHSNKRQVIMKNKSKYECRGKRKVALQDLEFTFSRNSVVFQQTVFPRDDVIEGAMLLMDLSCGLFPF